MKERRGERERRRMCKKFTKIKERGKYQKRNKDRDIK